MEITSDYLIIGSGIAGLSFALKAALRGTVNIVTKKEKMDASTNYAQGGIASVLDPQDSFDLHMADTLESGAGLCNEEVVRMVVTNGPAMIQELVSLGVRFSRNKKQANRLDLTQEGGHSRRRIVHTDDLTGQEVERALIHNVEKESNVRIYENHMAIDLITTSKFIRRGISTNESEETCWGAYVLDIHTGEVKTFLARVTVLATGGAGKVYLYTSNPDIATGDGLAIGYRAGAKVQTWNLYNSIPHVSTIPWQRTF